MNDRQKLPKLSRKVQAFVDEYFICGMNATEAYLRLHPNSSYDAARANSARTLANDNVKEHVNARMLEKQMDADEALTRLADMARGDLGDMTNDFGGVDWMEAKKRGLTKLVKKWKVRTIIINGKEEDKEIITEEIELHDPKDAIDKILRAHGRYKDALDLKNSDGSLNENIYNRVMERISGRLANGQPTGAKKTSKQVDGDGT